MGLVTGVGGADRPAGDVEGEYLATLSEAVTPDRWRKIVQRAIDDAEPGDLVAKADGELDLLCQHSVSVPSPATREVAAIRAEYRECQHSVSVPSPATEDFRPRGHSISTCQHSASVPSPATRPN